MAALLFAVGPAYGQNGPHCADLFSAHTIPPAQLARGFLGHFFKTRAPARMTYERFAEPWPDGRPNYYLKLDLNTADDVGLHRFSIHSLASRNWNSHVELNETSNPQAEKDFERVILRSVDFVMDLYRRRRAHWAPEFIAKLRELAIEYKNESTYINDESGPFSGEPLDSASTEMIASVRMIREKGGLLPMEKYLGITVKTDAKTLKVEPGNYAIETQASDIGQVTTSVGMIALDKKYQKQFNKTPHYMTYADEFSERLYAGMGFKPIPPEMIDNFEKLEGPIQIDKESGGIRILRHGIWWMPMHLPHDEFIEMLEEKIHRIAMKRGGDLLVQHIHWLLDDVLRINTAEHVFRSVRNVGSPGPVGRLRIFRNSVGGDDVELYEGDEMLRNNIIPSHLMRVGIQTPMVEGQVVSNGWGKMVYQNGILRVHQDFLTVAEGDEKKYSPYIKVRRRLELKVDADLHEPTEVYFKASRGTKVIKTFRLKFAKSPN